MNIAQCKICRKPFQAYGKICSDCLEQIEKDYVTIRDYLYDNPDEADAEELAKNTGVSEVIILHLMNENRLFAKSSDSEGTGRCQICGTSISGGRVCVNCNKLLTAGLRDSLPKPKPVRDNKYAKMHIRSDDDRRK